MSNQSLVKNPLERPMESAALYYAQHLNDSAHKFLDKMCLSADSTLQVGFADRTLGKQIPSNAFKSGARLRTELKRVGLLKASGHEALRGFVTVPLKDANDLITGIYGMRVDNHGKTQPQLTVGYGIFNAAALINFSEVIVCGNVLDAWTLFAAGHTNAIAAEGIQLTRQHFSRVARVLLADPCIDCEPLAHLEVLRIHFPEDINVNQYAILNRNIDDALGKRIRAATHLSSNRSSQEPTLEEPEVAYGKAAADNVKPMKPAAPTASPAPEPPEDIEVARSDTEIVLRMESRRWRVRGLDRNTTSGIMRVNLLVFNERNERFHVDTLDLYHSRSRRVYLKEAGEETALTEHELRSDLGRVLLKLEELQHEQGQAGGSAKTRMPEMSDEERAAAMSLLHDENLLDRILEDFETCGIVGEQTGKLVGYLVVTSRLLEKPLGLIIQSSSAAGKSSLADALLRFMPPEEQFSCSAMTSQSLYYLGQQDLKHKILAVAEEEGVRNAAYQLKLLQSEGYLSLVATSKESGTGRTSTERYEVEGPVASVLTTTALDIDPELLNRCLVVSVDESHEQTLAIHRLQRKARTFAGIERASHREQIEVRHQNAQRLLRSLVVVNPYAEQLKFMGNQPRHRRDHIKYLTLIEVVALLHQYQREIRRAEINGKAIEYIEVTRRDITMANVLADWALGRSIDELTGPTRRLLIALYDWLCSEAETRRLNLSEITFTRRQAREAIGWSATPMRIHLERLCRHEYVVANGGGGHGKLRRYSLLYDGGGSQGHRSVSGLIDPATLIEPEPATTTPKLTGKNGS